LAPWDFFLFLQPKDYPVGDKISGLWEDTAECTQQLQNSFQNRPVTDALKTGRITVISAYFVAVQL
jgi:hypothetical protein